MPNLRLPSRKAFTLIELLVVVGIIVALIAVLLPVLSKARAHAQRAKCAANLRGIGQALTIYTTDYSHYPGAVLDQRYGNAVIWPLRLRAFARVGQNLFYCPSQNPRCEWKTETAPRTVGKAGTGHTPYGYRPGEPLLDPVRTFFSYGYNIRGGSGGGTLGLGFTVDGLGPPEPGYNRELRASRVRRPSQMIAIADSVADGWSDYAIEPYPNDGGASNPDNNPGPLSRLPGRIHGGGANVLFCDGHVQWFSQAELVLPPGSESLPISVERMWNYNHRSHKDPRR